MRMCVRAPNGHPPTKVNERHRMHSISVASTYINTIDAPVPVDCPRARADTPPTKAYAVHETHGRKPVPFTRERTGHAE
jgi:hypothetical protein